MPWKAALLTRVNLALEEKTIPSDTLFSAITASIFEQGLEAEAREALFGKENPLVVSAALPFQKERFYVPVASAQPFLSQKPEEYVTLKKLKKIAFIEASLLERAPFKPQTLLEEGAAHAGHAVEDEAKTAVDRLHGGPDESRLFVRSVVRTGRDSGFYFLFNTGHEALVENALAHLARTGFLGSRSRGKGSFQQEIRDAPFELKTQGSHCLALGLFAPAREEMHCIQKAPAKCWYRIVWRSGWPEVHFSEDGRQQRKPWRAFFQEGSVFPGLGKAFAGRREKYKEIEAYWNGLAPTAHFHGGPL